MYLLWASTGSDALADIISFTHQTSPMRKVLLLSPFCRWELKILVVMISWVWSWFLKKINSAQLNYTDQTSEQSNTCYILFVCITVASSEKWQQNTFSSSACMGHWNRWAATVVLYSSLALTSSCLVRVCASHLGLLPPDPSLLCFL